MSNFGFGNNPFEGILGELMRAMGASQQGPINWDVARQVAQVVALQPEPDGTADEALAQSLDIDPTQPVTPESFDFQQLLAKGAGQMQVPTEANVDPALRIELGELLRVAEMHVAQTTGITFAGVQPTVVNRTEWVKITLDSWKPLFEAMAQSLAAEQALAQPGDVESPEDTDPNDPMAAMASMAKMMGPTLIAMQVGGMVGQMASRALGSFDYPIPRPVVPASAEVAGSSGAHELLVGLIAPNIAAMAEDWSLPVDQLGLHVCIGEVARTAVLNQPHVAKRFSELLLEYASGFRPNSPEVQHHLQQLEPQDQADLDNLFANPRMLLGAIQTNDQRVVVLRISALVAALVGYVDHITDKIAQQLIPSHAAIDEVRKRMRVEESEAQRLSEELMGLELSQANFDRGEAFVAGIVERAGEEGLARLWESQANLPNPAEIDAPGLWLARIDLPT